MPAILGLMMVVLISDDYISVFLAFGIWVCFWRMMMCGRVFLKIEEKKMVIGFDIWFMNVLIFCMCI